jgi:16S rRNA (guanine527-N7)-methyltransferase
VKHLSCQLARYAELLRTEGSETLSKGDVAKVDDHISDALTAIPHIEALGVNSIVDVGSGGGVPAIPVALELPEVSVTLVESVQRKCAFLELCAAEFPEGGITVRCARSEDVAATDREGFDLATARALAALPVALEYLAPLVRIGGHVMIWTTTTATDTELTGVSQQLGLEAPVSIPAPSALRGDGALLVAQKVSLTPKKYPRRPGMAKKRPLA